MQDQVDWQQASDWQHVGMLQQQHREVQRLQDLVHSKQMTITNLQQQIHVLEKKSQQVSWLCFKSQTILTNHAVYK